MYILSGWISVVGMLDTGIGETGVNTFMSAMNIPTINKNTLKRSERIVGSMVDQLAEQSCVAAIENEKTLTLENDLK